MESPLFSVQSGETFVEEGRIASDLVFLVSGSAHLVSKSAGVLPEAKLSISRFEAVNLPAVLQGAPHPAGAVATAPSVILIIPWNKLESLIKSHLPLRTYLLLNAQHRAIRELGQNLSDLGCSEAFQVQLIGSLREERLAPETWVIRQGEPAGGAFAVLDGSVQAYRKTPDNTLSPLWIVTPMEWQLWEESCAGTASDLGFKSLDTIHIFWLDKLAIQGLRQDFPNDLENFANFAKKKPTHVQDDGPLEGEEVQSVEALFPKLPRGLPWFRIQYPFVRQHDEMDCAAACMVMISQYYGNDIPIHYWRDRLGTDQEGTSLFSISQTAERAGFVAYGLQLSSLEGVSSSLFPLIALRRFHFFVVYAIKHGQVIVGDPGAGIRNIPIKQFEEKFEGYAVMMRPTERFYKVTALKRGWLHFLEMLNGQGRELATVLFCALLLALFGAIPPLLSQVIFDDVLYKKDMSLLTVLLAALVVINLLIALTSGLRDYFLAYLASKLDFITSSGFMQKVFSLPYEFIVSRTIGDFQNRLDGLQQIRGFLTGQVVGIILNFINLIVYSTLLFIYNPLMAMAAMAAGPLLLVMATLFGYRMRSAASEIFDTMGEQISLMNDQLTGVATIKCLSSELAARWRFDEAMVNTLRARYEFSLTVTGLRGTQNFLSNVLHVGFLGLAVYLCIRQGMTPGQVIASIMLADQMMNPFAGLASAWGDFQQLRVTADRLNDVFMAEPEIRSSSRSLVKQRLRGEIEFRDVWFRYGGESGDWVLKGTSFHISAGSNVAIVGHNGSGKSTVALLTARLYEPQKGLILIDGRDYRDYDRQWLRTEIGLMLSESRLFYGTIGENIAYGDPRPDPVRVQAAAEAAEAHEFIMEKHGGYDHRIYHNGLGLSNGEKQRIAIARRFYTHPSVLFLDEATSALDAEAERSILARLKGESGQRTVVNIAHRYTTARSASYVLVLNEGRVEESGTHEQLLAKRGLYHQIFFGQMDML